MSAHHHTKGSDPTGYLHASADSVIQMPTVSMAREVIHKMDYRNSFPSPIQKRGPSRLDSPSSKMERQPEALLMELYIYTQRRWAPDRRTIQASANHHTEVSDLTRYQHASAGASPTHLFVPRGAGQTSPFAINEMFVYSFPRAPLSGHAPPPTFLCPAGPGKRALSQYTEFLFMHFDARR